MWFTIKFGGALACAIFAFCATTGAGASPPSPDQLQQWKGHFSWNPSGRFAYNVLFDAVDPRSPTKRSVSSCQTQMNDVFLNKVLDSDYKFIPVEAAYIWMPTVSILARDRGLVDHYRAQFLELCNSTRLSVGYLQYSLVADYTGDYP